MLRLLIVDDEPAVRKGLRMRFAADQEVAVVGEAATGEEALALARALRPDVVLMDVELPRMDGIAATQALRATFPQMPVIVLTIHDDARTRHRALAAGAFRFITKRGSNGELISALRLAAAASAGDALRERN